VLSARDWEKQAYGMYGALTNVASLVTPCANKKRYKRWQSILDQPLDEMGDGTNIAHTVRLVSDD
jgi:hypothetical protein